VSDRERRLGALLGMGVLVIATTIVAWLGLLVLSAIVFAVFSLSPALWPGEWAHLGLALIVAVVILVSMGPEGVWKNLQFTTLGFGAYSLYFLGVAAVCGVVLYFEPWSHIALAAVYLSPWIQFALAVLVISAVVWLSKR
jgi:hypothetical protein